MIDHKHIAREISYASSAKTKSGKAMIRVMENVTGRMRLIRRAQGYEHEVARGRDFWEVMMERYGLSLDVVGGSLSNIPRKGPLLLVANHPYGILDGLVMGHILSHVRGDFRILAHRVFRKAKELNRFILPIDFDETRTALRQNLKTRKTALDYLKQGGALGVFPGGTVSTSPKIFAPAMDPGWRNFTARISAKSNAAVVPVFFDGCNSRLFQIASHIHYTLRMGLLIKEFNARVDEPVRVVVGTPIPRKEMRKHADDTRAMMDFLRQSTYALSPRPLKSIGYGFEFEEKHRA